MIWDITNPFSYRYRLRSPGSCSPQHCPRPHTYPPHHPDSPAQYPATNSPSPPPPQTGHAPPETTPHHHRRKTPATTSPPARPDQSSTASTPPWPQTPTATPPTAECEHPTNSSLKSFPHLISVAVQRHSVVLAVSRRPGVGQHGHSRPVSETVIGKSSQSGRLFTVLRHGAGESERARAPIRRLRRGSPIG